MLEAYEWLIRITVILIVLIAVYNYIRSVCIRRILLNISDSGATSSERAKSPAELGVDSPFAIFLLRDGSILNKKIMIADDIPPEEALKQKRKITSDKKIFIEEDALFGMLVRYDGNGIGKTQGAVSLVLGCAALFVAGELVIRYWNEIYSLISGLVNAF